MRQWERRSLVVDREPVVRPRGAPKSYACPACDVILYDGVDYTWCPVCSRPVDWVDLAKPFWCCDTCDAIVNEVRVDWPRCADCDRAMSRVHALESPPPSSSRSSSGGGGTATTVGLSAIGLLKLVQVVVLALDPLGFVYVAPLLLLAVLGAGALLMVVLGSLGELRALVRDHRTRVLHGLEHACLKLLERDGRATLGGQTHDGCFEVRLANDGRASVEAVQRAANEAIARVAAGEVALTLDRRCGTSLLVGAMLVAALVVAGAVVGLVAGVHPGLLAAGTALAALLAWRGAQPLGLLAQRALTVSARFTTARVQRIARRVDPSGRWATFVVYAHVQVA